MWNRYGSASGRKFGNKKVTTPDGKTFDSKKEAARYYELLLLQRAGEISELETQKEFELIPAQYETCKLYDPEKDKCYACFEMYCKSGNCKYYIDKAHKGWGDK